MAMKPEDSIRDRLRARLTDNGFQYLLLAGKGQGAAASSYWYQLLELRSCVSVVFGMDDPLYIEFDTKISETMKQAKELRIKTA